MLFQVMTGYVRFVQLDQIRTGSFML